MTTSSSTATAASPPTAEHRNRTIRVAFQGELGAYGDEAIAQRWRGAATAIPSVSFENVVANVACGLADYGILPVWNTVVGNIAPGCAAVAVGCGATYKLVVTGDAHVIVRHQLLGLPGASLDGIDSVTSHPVALAQCGEFLAAHPNIVPNPVYDTAGAARDLAVNGVCTSTAIAGRIAAERYGLAILQADVQDVPNNVTHFLVLARPDDQRDDLQGERSDEVVRW